MGHEQSLTHAGARESNRQRLLTQAAFRDLVKVIEVELKLFFETMIELKAFIRVLEEVVTNVCVEAYTKRITQELRDCTFVEFFDFAIENKNRLTNCVVDRFVLTELFCGVDKPCLIGLLIIVQVVESRSDLFVAFFVQIVRFIDRDTKRGLSW